MGVGGDNSWMPMVHAPYLVPPDIYPEGSGKMEYTSQGGTLSARVLARSHEGSDHELWS